MGEELDLIVRSGGWRTTGKEEGEVTSMDGAFSVKVLLGSMLVRVVEEEVCGVVEVEVAVSPRDPLPFILSEIKFKKRMGSTV